MRRLNPPRPRTPEAKRLPRLAHLRLIARRWTRQAPIGVRTARRPKGDRKNKWLWATRRVCDLSRAGPSHGCRLHRNGRAGPMTRVVYVRGFLRFYLCPNTSKLSSRCLDQGQSSGPGDPYSCGWCRPLCWGALYLIQQAPRQEPPVRCGFRF
jgi:hypothetical protein